MREFDPNRLITHADFRVLEWHIHIRVAMTCAAMIFSWWVLCGS